MQLLLTIIIKSIRLGIVGAASVPVSEAGLDAHLGPGAVPMAAARGLISEN